MADYISKEEYLAAVKRGIKWKKAREAATRELSDHIDDLCDKYAADGTEKEKALAEHGSDLEPMFFPAECP